MKKQNSLKITHGLALLATTALVPANLQAALFTEDFEGYSVGSTIDTSGPWQMVTGNTSYRTVRNEATATPFGSPNQYGELADIADAPTSNAIRLQSPGISEASGAVTTLSFAFFEPQLSGQTQTFGVGYATATAPGTVADLNGAGERLRIFLGGGVIGGLSTGVSYSLDTPYKLHILFNDSPTEVTYMGGSIAQNSADVWLEPFGSGSFVYVGNKSAANTQTSHYSIGFRTFGPAIRTLLVDDVSLVEGAAAIPEPSAALLGGLGLLVLLRRRRD